MCSVYMPWSVTVDTEKYGAPSLEKVSVRLTRESDGKTWEFCNDPSQTAVTLDGQYFNVDLGAMGSPTPLSSGPAATRPGTACTPWRSSGWTSLWPTR